jgi:hypothetical protein
MRPISFAYNLDLVGRDFFFMLSLYSFARSRDWTVAQVFVTFSGCRGDRQSVLLVNFSRNSAWRASYPSFRHAFQLLRLRWIWKREKYIITEGQIPLFSTEKFYVSGKQFSHLDKPSRSQLHHPPPAPSTMVIARYEWELRGAGCDGKYQTKQVKHRDPPSVRCLPRALSSPSFPFYCFAILLSFFAKFSSILLWIFLTLSRSTAKILRQRNRGGKPWPNPNVTYPRKWLH